MLLQTATVAHAVSSADLLEVTLEKRDILCAAYAHFADPERYTYRKIIIVETA